MLSLQGDLELVSRWVQVALCWERGLDAGADVLMLGNLPGTLCSLIMTGLETHRAYACGVLRAVGWARERGRERGRGRGRGHGGRIEFEEYAWACDWAALVCMVEPWAKYQHAIMTLVRLLVLVASPNLSVGDGKFVAEWERALARACGRTAEGATDSQLEGGDGAAKAAAEARTGSGSSADQTGRTSSAFHRYLIELDATLFNGYQGTYRTSDLLRPPASRKHCTRTPHPPIYLPICPPAHLPTCPYLPISNHAPTYPPNHT